MKKILLTTSFMLAFTGLAQAELATPKLLTPENGANLPLKKAAKFSWQKVIGATKYRVIFSNEKNFSNYDANKFKCLNSKTCFLYTVASPSYNVTASHTLLKTDGNYFWQVQAINSKDTSQITTPTTTAGEVRSFFAGVTTPAAVVVNTNTTSSSYTKIANNGSVLPDSATIGTAQTDWACTKDNKTGLIWEVKTQDGGLRDTNNRYTWSEANDFTNSVNSQSLCGKTDWRLPTRDEQLGLMYCSDGKYNKFDEATLNSNPSSYVCATNEHEEGGLTTTCPTINTTYFPNHTCTYSELFWSSLNVDTRYKSPYSERAWLVTFMGGAASGNIPISLFGKNKTYNFFVRLVSG